MPLPSTTPTISSTFDHSDHPATSLTTVTTTTMFFALTLPSRRISTLLSPKKPETTETQRQPQRSPYYSSSLLFPHSYFSVVKWDAVSAPSLCHCLALSLPLALLLRPLAFLLILMLERNPRKKRQNPEKKTNKQSRKTSSSFIYLTTP